MSTKYKIYRIHVIGNKAWRCEIYTEDIERFRAETAVVFKVEKNKVKLCYETDEPYCIE